MNDNEDDLTPDEHEQELKRELELLLARFETQGPRPIASPVVSFDGEYPDTVLTIEYEQADGSRVDMSWTIWKGAGAWVTGEEPERGAFDVWVQLMER